MRRLIGKQKMVGVTPVIAAAALLALAGTVTAADQDAPARPPQTAGGPSSSGRSATVAARQPDATPHRLSEFAGAWDYNANDSVNAATGRPEQSPRSATQRTPGTRGGPLSGGRSGGRPGPLPGSGDDPGAFPGPGADPSGYGGAYGGYGGGYSPPGEGGPSGVGPTAEMVQQSRDLQRDLLEVPEALTINLAADAVTIVDDLGRSRTYSLGGAKGKYQLGASRFEAQMEWDGTRLIKHIEGAYGFKMTETYFLSGDGRRLFVIVRVGQRKKDDPLVGFNRVYDRVD